jgi:hypothetical protein
MPQIYAVPQEKQARAIMEISADHELAADAGFRLAISINPANLAA